MKNENPFQKNQEVTLTVDGITGEGQGVGRIGGVAFFVPGTVVGETVKAHIIKVEKRYCVAKVVSVLTESENRETPRCEAYPFCGGCTMQHMTYEEQLRRKHAIVTDALERLGGFRELRVLPVLGMDDPWRYRNKGLFPFGTVDGTTAFGFYAPRSHRLIPLYDCPIQSERVMATARKIAVWANRFCVPVYEETTGKGTLRGCMIRETTDGKQMAVVVTKGELTRESELKAALKGIDSLYHSRNDRDTNVLLDGRFRLLSGEATLTELQDGVAFSVSPQSFLQVNPIQTRTLYRTAIEYLAPKPEETILDLYCGIGTISLQIARRAGRVIGVECVPEAIEDAKANAKRNGTDNAEFLCGQTERVLPELLQRGVCPDAIVLDPPRKGCEPQALEAIASSGAKRLVYVSCDPATLARDLRLLCANGYSIESVQPVDMFPQTGHVESVVLMSRVGAKQ